MLWLGISVIAAAALAYRWWAAHSIGYKPPAWWWAFSLTFLGIATGSALRVNEEAVNHLSGIPNLCYLLSNLGFTLAAGSVNIYVHSLRRADQPVSRRRGWAHTGIAVAVAAIITVSWRVAPIHTVSYPTFRDAPVTPAAFGYDSTFHLYLAATVTNVALCAYRIATHRPAAGPDTSRVIGGCLVMTGSVLDLIAHILYLPHTLIDPALGTPRLHLVGIADALTFCCLIAIGLGSAVFVLGPRIMHHRHAHHLATELDPLWKRVRALYPSVALPGKPRRWPPLAAERKLIEIADAWRHLPVAAPHPSLEPPQVHVVTALTQTIQQDTTVKMPVAADVLPTAATRHDEEATALAVAHEYTARLDPAHAP